MTTEAIKSASLTNLDATPVVFSNAAQGAAGRPITVDDYCAVSATGIAAVGSTYQLLRIPSFAIPKGLVFASDQALDTNASNTLVFDLNLAFSDSSIDGTPSWLKGLVPTTANTGATTTFAAYSSPNICFGQYTPSSHTAAFMSGDLILNGSQTNYPLSLFTQQPLWQTFGFTDGRGNPADPGGFFDLVAYVSTGAATGHAGKLWAKMTYAR